MVCAKTTRDAYLRLRENGRKVLGPVSPDVPTKDRGTDETDETDKTRPGDPVHVSCANASATRARSLWRSDVRTV